jgi:hypothetical protein
MRDIKFKMRCTDGCGKSHTTGKVYNVYTDGFMDTDKEIWHDIADAVHTNIHTINKFYSSKFELYEGIGIGLESIATSPKSITRNLDTLTVHNIINDNLIKLLEEIDDAGFQSDLVKLKLEYEDADIICIIDL